jgi:hypothetical protein
MKRTKPCTLHRSIEQRLDRPRASQRSCHGAFDNRRSDRPRPAGPQAVDASSGVGSSSSGAAGEASSSGVVPTVDASMDTMVSSASSSGATCMPTADICVGKCGTLSNNGCGAPVACSQCVAPFQCNATTNLCECIPEAAAKACKNQCSGRAPDGCGGQVDCTKAVCDPNTETCLKRIGLDRCCTKDTKAKACAGAACGRKSDGCGGTVDCGTDCAGTDVCCQVFGQQGSGQCGPKNVFYTEIQ